MGFGEEYVETPMTTKHGEIIAVTREAVFFDRTGMVLSGPRWWAKSSALPRKSGSCS